MATENKNKYFQAIGRRKTSTAQIRIFPNGKGIIVINDKAIELYVPESDRQATLKSPIDKLGIKLDVTIKVSGGGKTGQIEAIRNGLAKAIVVMDSELKPALKAEGFLKRDARKKERKKPGLKKARRAKQWRKR